MGGKHAVAAIALIVAGCGPSSPYVPIRGVVTVDGVPLGTGTVVYLPKNQGAGRQANGPIQSDGSFVMTSVKRGDGVLPGEYDLIVRAYAAPERALSREERESGVKEADKKKLAAARYYQPETSGLSDSVGPDHSGVKNLDLTSEDASDGA